MDQWGPQDFKKISGGGDSGAEKKTEWLELQIPNPRTQFCVHTGTYTPMSIYTRLLR